MAVRSIIRTYVRVLLFLAITSQPVVADDLPGILIVEITGLREATGSVQIAVYDSDSTWLEDEAVLTRTVVIADTLDGDLVRTELELPMGEYAVSAFHDVDGNGELDTNFVGIPSEPIAVSNNVVKKFMAPKYEDAVFTLGAEPVIQHIIMREM